MRFARGAKPLSGAGTLASVRAEPLREMPWLTGQRTGDASLDVQQMAWKPRAIGDSFSRARRGINDHDRTDPSSQQVDGDRAACGADDGNSILLPGRRLRVVARSSPTGVDMAPAYRLVPCVGRPLGSKQAAARPGNDMRIVLRCPYVR